ncbi:MAG: pyridoxamine 5'-phosphate oxidase family protein [Candidatus Heimdallarchaeaceae archaeon]
MEKLENEVRKIIRKNNWLVLSTVNEKGIPQSSVVMYQSDGQSIFFMTSIDTLKAKNIRNNSHVSVTIPFFKSFLHKFVPAPPAELHFKAKAEIVPKDNEEAQRILAKMIKFAEKSKTKTESIWIKITPSKKVATYGVGIKLLDMRFPEKARNLVELTN